MATIELNEREKATVLSALRMYKEYINDYGTDELAEGDPYFGSIDPFVSLEPLDHDEVVELAFRLKLAK